MSPRNDRVEQRAVIDRIVDGIHAVLIVGDAEEQISVPVSSLPAGASAGTWLQVRFDGDKLVSATIDAGYTAGRRGRIAGKLSRLRHRDRQNRC